MESPFVVSLYSAEDVKRLQSAKAISKKKIWVDTKAKRAAVDGSASEPYKVTLVACTCPDFAIRQRPCKHMMRLAMEVGVDFGMPEFDPVAAAQYDVHADINLIYKRWMAGQITTDAYVACVAALLKSSGKAKK